MTIVLEVWLHDKLNISPLVDLGGFQSLTYGRKANAIGELSITLPLRYYQPSLFTQDSVITVKENGNLANDTIWLVKHISISSGFFTVTCDDAMAFLARRYVLYAVGQPQSEKFEVLDNMAKAVVRENLTNATDINRNFAGLTVAANVGYAPSERMAFAWKNVLSTLQEMATNSQRQGQYLTFDFRMTTPSTGIFTTWVGVRGTDRRLAANLRTFTLDDFEAGAEVVINYENRLTKVTALGAGQNELRKNSTVTDETALYNTRWGVIEGIVEDSNQADPFYLRGLARSQISTDTPILFRGTLAERNGNRYGKDFAYGDILPIDAYGYQFACRVVTVLTTISQNEMKRICQLEAV